MLAVLLLLLLATPAWCEPHRFAVQLDHRHDVLVRRCVVPSPAQPQGEVQVLKRGDLVVVRTLLASRTLKRVAAAIVAKEQRSWPPGSPGHAGSLHYREELHQAVETAWRVFRERPDATERRQFLAIEFITGPRHNLVALSLPQLEGEPGALYLRDQQVLAAWSGPRDYVAPNSTDIVADSFGLSADAAEELLATARRQARPDAAERE